VLFYTLTDCCNRYVFQEQITLPTEQLKQVLERCDAGQNHYIQIPFAPPVQGFAVEPRGLGATVALDVIDCRTSGHQPVMQKLTSTLSAEDHDLVPPHRL
jgi:hypothetical protein